MFGHVPFLPVNQILSRHNVIWQPTVTKYSDDIFTQACLATYPLLRKYARARTPFEHGRARTPLPFVNQTLSRHDIIQN